EQVDDGTDALLFPVRAGHPPGFKQLGDLQLPRRRPRQYIPPTTYAVNGIPTWRRYPSAGCVGEETEVGVRTRRGAPKSAGVAWGRRSGQGEVGQGTKSERRFGGIPRQCRSGRQPSCRGVTIGTSPRDSHSSSSTGSKECMATRPPAAWPPHGATRQGLRSRHREQDLLRGAN